MPIYEYQCQACGHEFEALRKISDDPLQDCPSCKEAELKKKVSAAAFRFKGSGWYETDFKTGNKKNLAGDGDSASKAASSEPSGSKPDGKSDTKKASTDSSGDSKKSA
ncbi:MAG: putative FmdB family regulatory protein [Bacteroidia bacterium]|jgi:putative FmdB family regulatory protein